MKKHLKVRQQLTRNKEQGAVWAPLGQHYRLVFAARNLWGRGKGAAGQQMSMQRTSAAVANWCWCSCCMLHMLQNGRAAIEATSCPLRRRLAWRRPVKQPSGAASATQAGHVSILTSSPCAARSSRHQAPHQPPRALCRPMACWGAARSPTPACIAAWGLNAVYLSCSVCCVGWVGSHRSPRQPSGSTTDTQHIKHSRHSRRQAQQAQ